MRKIIIASMLGALISAAEARIIQPPFADTGFTFLKSENGVSTVVAGGMTYTKDLTSEGYNYNGSIRDKVVYQIPDTLLPLLASYDKNKKAISAQIIDGQPAFVLHLEKIQLIGRIEDLKGGSKCEIVQTGNGEAFKCPDLREIGKVPEESHVIPGSDKGEGWGPRYRKSKSRNLKQFVNPDDLQAQKK